MQTEISAPQKKHRDHGWTLTFIIISLTIVAGVFYAGGIIPEVKKTYFLKDSEGIPVEKQNPNAQNNLQIDTLTFVTKPPASITQPIPTIPASIPPGTTITAAPPPTVGPGTCQSEGYIVNGCQCPFAYEPEAFPALTERQITCPGPDCEPIVAACRQCLNSSESDLVPCTVPFRQYSLRIHCTRNFVNAALPGSLPFCFGKPVIYLYPEKPTYVSVKLNIPGEIYISDPHYPEEGWKDVLAHPDGTLYYQGKKYHELYYESAVSDVKTPKNGIIVPKKQIKQEIIRVTTQLGLIKHEQDEFLEYWMPKVEEINKPFILISLIDPVEKERIDGIEYSIEPDTRIEFLVYFKGVDKKKKIEPLKLPEKIPERIGFTAVEWGGTIHE